MVADSPAYFKHKPQPRTPHELGEHDCIGLRLPTYGGSLPWDSKHDERTAHRWRSLNALPPQSP
jgi:hypothetical protein